jgi:hypothetical protein
VDVALASFLKTDTHLGEELVETFSAYITPDVQSRG